MQRTALQMDIDDAPRRRVPLIDDTEVVTLRVPNAVAKIVNRTDYKKLEANLEAGVKHLIAVDKALTVRLDASLKLLADDSLEVKIGYTEWSKGRPPPPCTGYWDICPISVVVRVWYDAQRDLWRKDGPSGHVIPWPSRWRGLKAPWPMGYDYNVPVFGDGMKHVLPVKGQNITLQYQGQVDASVQGYEINGTLAVPGEEGVTYVTREQACEFFGLIDPHVMRIGIAHFIQHGGSPYLLPRLERGTNSWLLCGSIDGVSWTLDLTKVEKALS